MAAPAHDFHDQFVLSPDKAAPAPAPFVSRQIDDWVLSAHPALPVFNVITGGEAVGWLIGHAVAADGSLVCGDVTIEDASPKTFESWLYTHGGRFCGVLLTPGAKRVYLDPLGTLSLVFAKGPPLAGSTSSLLFYADREHFADAMYAEHRVAANQFFPAGLTSRPDVERLLPNHFLDLDGWSVARHWPTEPILRAADDASAVEIMRDVTDTIRRTIEGVAEHYPLYVTISAGRDSRMVMGCARGVLDRATFVTFAYPDKEKFADVHVATRLCKRVGVRHVVLPMAPTETPDKQRYLYRIGYDGNWGKARDFDGACARHLEMNHAWLTGFGAEIRRPFYWVPSEVAKTVFEPADLLRRMKLPADDASLRAVEQWLARTPLGDPITAFDLMYIEQKVGSWASPQMYGAAPFAVNMTPLCHRRVLEQMMRLPPSYRARHKAADEMLRLTWPELLDLPYNEVTGVRLLVKRVREKVRHKLKRIGQRVRGELR